MTTQRTADIHFFIVEHVEQHPSDIVALTSSQFGLSRQAINKHVRELCEKGILQASGQTRSRRYQLVTLDRVQTTVVLEGQSEDVVWTNHLRSHLEGVPSNVIGVLNYGFTEMLNNAIDHSQSEAADIKMLRTAMTIQIEVRDYGIGIFRKIAQAIGLHDEREAILELAKGKLTTDPEHHSGEGIFFTSRMVDSFAILSRNLFFSHDRGDNDWLIEVEEPEFSGTLVRMTVGLSSKMQLKDLFSHYATDSDEFSFSRTHAPIKLAQYGSDNLISRSQARRVLTRFERFAEVILDFQGVDFIGQAFADEIFRVFQNAHPGTRLIAINTLPIVAGMIKRAQFAAAENKT